MTINTNTLVGGGNIELAPDLNYPINSTGSLVRTVTGIDGSAGIVTALSLTGKWVINNINFSAVTSTQDLTLKLTVDSVVIWNSISNISGNPVDFLGKLGDGLSESIICNASFLLEVSNGTDNSITLNYVARPIL